MPAEKLPGRLAATLALLVALQGCGREEESRLLPGFRQAEVDRIAFETAGHQPLLTLEFEGGRWKAREYDGWPVAHARVQGLLDGLAQARIVERKTSRPDLHPRLGVEDLSAADASGIGLSWRGGAGQGALVLGKPGPGGQGQYLRPQGADQALLVDRNLLPGGDPLAWLDRRLLDLPSSRIREVRVRPRDGTAFVVRMDASGHVLEGVPGALSDASACAALASALGQLEFEDLASPGDGGMVIAPEPANGATQADPALAAADFSSEFLAVDGRRVLVEGWRREARYWVTLSVSLDLDEARAWLGRGADGQAAAALARLQDEVARLQARLQGRRFLLGLDRTAALVRRRPQYLVAP